MASHAYLILQQINADYGAISFLQSANGHETYTSNNAVRPFVTEMEKAMSNVYTSTSPVT